MTQSIVARADVARLRNPFDSENESYWNSQGAHIIGAELACEVAETFYHPLTVHIPGGTYTPDFLHILQDGRMVLVEVKALIFKRKVVERDDGTAEVRKVKNSRAQHGYRDARSKLRAAQATYPFLLWYEARVGKRGEYELEMICT